MSETRSKVQGRAARRVGVIGAICASLSAACVAADAPVPQSQPMNVSATAGTGDADLRRGRIMFLQCRACHTTEADGEHRVGPNLHGLIGASAGSKEGFTYSEAMAGSEIVWGDDALDEFLLRPTDYVPGTIMVFAGIESADDRRALIAFIKSQVE